MGDAIYPAWVQGDSMSNSTPALYQLILLQESACGGQVVGCLVKSWLISGQMDR